MVFIYIYFSYNLLHYSYYFILITYFKSYLHYLHSLIT